MYIPRNSYTWYTGTHAKWFPMVHPNYHLRFFFLPVDLLKTCSSLYKCTVLKRTVPYLCTFRNGEQCAVERAASHLLLPCMCSTCIYNTYYISILSNTQIQVNRERRRRWSGSTRGIHRWSLGRCQQPLLRHISTKHNQHTSATATASIPKKVRANLYDL